MNAGSIRSDSHSEHPSFISHERQALGLFRMNDHAVIPHRRGLDLIDEPDLAIQLSQGEVARLGSCRSGI